MTRLPVAKSAMLVMVYEFCKIVKARFLQLHAIRLSYCFAFSMHKALYRFDGSVR